jgi:hypothetical protein
MNAKDFRCSGNLTRFLGTLHDQRRIVQQKIICLYKVNIERQLLSFKNKWNYLAKKRNPSWETLPQSRGWQSQTCHRLISARAWFLFPWKGAYFNATIETTISSYGTPVQIASSVRDCSRRHIWHAIGGFQSDGPWQRWIFVLFSLNKIIPWCCISDQTFKLIKRFCTCICLGLLIRDQCTPAAVLVMQTVHLSVHPAYTYMIKDLHRDKCTNYYRNWRISRGANLLSMKLRCRQQALTQQQCITIMPMIDS